MSSRYSCLHIFLSLEICSHKVKVSHKIVPLILCKSCVWAFKKSLFRLEWFPLSKIIAF